MCIDGFVDVMITVLLQGMLLVELGLSFESLCIDHEIDHFASEHIIYIRTRAREY